MERATTYAVLPQALEQGLPAPVEPAGGRWVMTGMAVHDGALFWAWERPEAPAPKPGKGPCIPG